MKALTFISRLFLLTFFISWGNFAMADDTATLQAALATPQVQANLPAFVKKLLAFPGRLEAGFMIPGADPEGAGFMTNWVPCGTIFHHDICAVLGANIGGQFGIQAGFRVPVKKFANGKVILDIETLLALGIHFPHIGDAEALVIPLTGQMDVGLNISPSNLEGATIRTALGLSGGGNLNPDSISNAYGVGIFASAAINADGQTILKLIQRINGAIAPKIN